MSLIILECEQKRCCPGERGNVVDANTTHSCWHRKFFALFKIVAPILIRGHNNPPLSPFWPIKKCQLDRKVGGAILRGLQKSFVASKSNSFLPRLDTVRRLLSPLSSPAATLIFHHPAQCVNQRGKGQPVRKMQKMKSWRSSRSTEPSDDYPSTVEFSLSSGAEEAVPGRDEGYLAFLNFLSADSAHNEKGAATNGGKGGKAPLHRILEEQLNGTSSYTSSHDIYDKAFPEEEIYDADCYVGNHYSSRPSNLTEEEEGKTRQMNVNSATPPKRNMRRKLSALGGMDPLPQAQTTDGQDSGYEEIRAAFEKEHKAVRKFKIVVVLVLVAAAIAVSAIVYRFTSRGEENTMVMEYADYADKFITNFHHLQGEFFGSMYLYFKCVVYLLLT